MDHVFLQFRQVSGEPARTDNELELFGRMPAAAVAGLHAEQSRQHARAAFHHGDEHGHEPVENHQRGGYDHCQPVGLVDRQVLRHHFADHYMAEGHQPECQHEADGAQNRGTRGCQ